MKLSVKLRVLRMPDNVKVNQNDKCSHSKFVQFDVTWTIAAQYRQVCKNSERRTVITDIKPDWIESTRNIMREPQGMCFFYQTILQQDQRRATLEEYGLVIADFAEPNTVKHYEKASKSVSRNMWYFRHDVNGFYEVRHTHIWYIVCWMPMMITNWACMLVCHLCAEQKFDFLELCKLV